MNVYIKLEFYVTILFQQSSSKTRNFKNKDYKVWQINMSG
jgi:hypothetical protein